VTAAIDQSEFLCHYNLVYAAGGEWQQAIALLAAMETLEVP